ncbi:hypothetical protein AA106555_2015 [Neokomagataea thailandica NBRC 106555]|uniref:Uncharacterized protein n=1 Tax=Neokomagataea thailandica NBRC 106555 TaxID=1223520 RepID=A0ABQ0QSL8_9PROT|nr:hypothetical protein AA106555_2015 [Neokomagataea thailandica NBRC 106555]
MVEACFSLCGCDITDGRENTAIIEPIDPFEGCKFNVAFSFPWPLPIDQLGFVETVNRLCERIVIGIPDTAYGCDKPCFGKALCVAQTGILTAAIGVIGD